MRRSRASGPGGRSPQATSPHAPTEAATITVPALVLWGERDEILARADQEALTAAIPGAELVVYPDTGHLVLFERPDDVARDLMRLLARAPCDTGLP